MERKKKVGKVEGTHITVECPTRGSPVAFNLPVPERDRETVLVLGVARHASLLTSFLQFTRPYNTYQPSRTTATNFNTMDLPIVNYSKSEYIETVLVHTSRNKETSHVVLGSRDVMTPENN